MQINKLSLFTFLLISCFLGVIFIPTVSFGQDKLLDIIRDEMNRELKVLSKQEVPPYYIGYRVDDIFETRVEASFGTITNSEDSKRRHLTVSVRTGKNDLDNTREIRGDDFAGYLSMIPGRAFLPLDDNPEAIKSVLWKETNDKYRKAVEDLAKVKANIAVKVATEDSSADFTVEKAPNNYVEPPFQPGQLTCDRKKWEEKLKKYSALFLSEPDIYGGNSSFSYSADRKYFISSEGTTIAQNLTYARIAVSGYMKSDDGMELPLYKTYFAFTEAGLPSDEEIEKDVRDMIKKLKALKEAPVVDPYTGPAIMSGRASGVFFHEIFGHRIEGHRQKSETEGQTFKKKVGEKILPESMSVVFEPEKKKVGGQDLNGYYLYDDEGVKSRKVTIVENGILKDFLMSRTPFQNFPNSNGHGRAQAGYQPVSRQSNLIVETTKPLSMADLRKKLIDECKKQGKEYGYFFVDITGGFTMTGRTLPNSFNVMPTEVYRVFVDGRPDQIVRGVDLVGTPLSMFSEISDAGNEPEVFTGTCGAESGGVPVTACSPALFVNKIEMQKKEKSQDRPPLLSRPDAGKDK